MPTQSSPLTAPSSLETQVSEKLDWKSPLMLVTAALVFIGVSSVLRLLPIPKFWADLLAVAVVLAWQYGLHLAEIDKWNWRGSMATFSSFPQGVLNFVALFVGLFTVFSWVVREQTAENVFMAGGVSSLMVFTKFRSKTSRSRSANA